jgi:hypothetical protein
MRYPFASSSPLRAAVAPIDKASSTSTTVTTSTSPGDFPLPTRRTHPYPAYLPNLPILPGLDGSQSRSLIPENNTTLASPVTSFKQRLLHKASSVRFKVRRTAEPGEDRPLDHKVPPSALRKSFVKGTPTTVLPDLDRTPEQSLPRSTSLSSVDFESLSHSIRRFQLPREGHKDYSQQSITTNHTFVKMASESAQPPVSYSRLQQITTSVSPICTLKSKGFSGSR